MVQGLSPFAASVVGILPTLSDRAVDKLDVQARLQTAARSKMAGSGRRVGDNRLNFVKLPTDLALGDFYIVTVLEIHPELCGGTKCLAETQRGIGGDPSCFRCNTFDARAWQVTRLGERASGQIERQKKFFSQNFSGMHGRKLFCHFYHSMFGDHFKVSGTR
jgi:hypothetical protein